MQLCEFTPLSAIGIYCGLFLIAAGVIGAVGLLVGHQRRYIRIPLASILVGLILCAGSIALVVAGSPGPWSGNGEPPCPSAIAGLAAQGVAHPPAIARPGAFEPDVPPFS